MISFCSCLEPCPYGMYGMNCASECGKCKDIDNSEHQCEIATGVCVHGCQDSWFGDLCDQDVCAYTMPCLNNGVCTVSMESYR